MGEGSWAARLGAYPGSDGEGLGLRAEPGEPARVVRIRRLPPASGEPRTRLVREVARAAEVLHHPNILAPVAVEEEGGSLVLVVEQADGETLREILEVGGRLPAPVAARVVRDACAAVHFAHEEGHEDGPFVHGGIEPGQLLVSRAGVTLVGGFGLAAARAQAELVPWQSPEQVLGGPRAASRQSDVYLLGLLLHACLAGENPFARDPDPGVAILSRPPASLEPLGVPPALAAVARRALSVRAADRFATAEEMARAVDEAVPDLAGPGAVAAWVESLFPAGMGLRAQRQRAVESAWQAARAGPGAPEEVGEEHILEAPHPLEAEAAAEDLRTGQFQLAAPPFPQGVAGGWGRPDGNGEGRGADRGPVIPVGPPDAPATPRRDVPARPAPPPTPVAPRSPPPAPATPSPRAAPPAAAPAAAPAGEPPAIAFSPIPPTPERRPGLARAAAVAGVAVAGLALGWWLSAPSGGAPRPLAPEAGGASAAPAPAPAPPAEPVPSPAGRPAAATASRSPSPPASPAGALPRRPAAPAARAPQGPAGATSPAPAAGGRPPAEGRPILAVDASEPGELFIDGRRAGRPPVERAVAPGRREVRLLEANLGLDVTRLVEVRPPRTSVRIEVGRARLTVRAPPAAEIALDGRVVARGAIRDLEIWEGRHRLEVALGEARDRHDFRVGANETYEYDVEAVAR